MVLPSGVNKATGVLAALSEMCVSHHNAIGIGDAENDHALLGACECGIAVANSIQTLRERADVITTRPPTARASRRSSTGCCSTTFAACEID